METSKERIFKVVDHLQPAAVPINIEGLYADLQPWYDNIDVDNKLVGLTGNVPVRFTSAPA